MSGSMPLRALTGSSTIAIRAESLATRSGDEADSVRVERSVPQIRRAYVPQIRRA